MAERIDLSASPLPKKGSAPPKKRRGSGASKWEDIARRIFQYSALLSVLLLSYLLWGLWSGAWSHEALEHLNSAGRERQFENAALIVKVLSASLLISVASLLVCCARDEGTGYWLLGAAAFVGGGIPFLTNQIFYLHHQTASRVSIILLQDFESLAWLFAIPGIIWAVIDLARRFGEAAESAAIQRASVKYGATAAKQSGSRQRQVFLGRCWEGPFCKDNIRVKCPIYLKKRGPCWWYKKGCMCEESIVLQAMIAPDWREKSAEARKSLEMGGRGKELSPEAKRERCRNCIIYNEHQQQKHKALSTAALIALPAFFVLNFAWIEVTVAHFLQGVDAMTRRFSFSSDTSGLAVLHNGNDAYGIIVWVSVFAFAVVLLSQVLKLIEYCCFRLKI